MPRSSPRLAPPPPPPSHPSSSSGPQGLGSDPILQAGIVQITKQDVHSDPSKYQTESTLVLRRFFDLWVDGSLKLTEADYVLKITGMYLDEVETIHWTRRDYQGGDRWLMGRCLGLKARVLAGQGEEEEGGRGRLRSAVAERAGETARRVAEMVGAEDATGKVGEHGEAHREKVWKGILEDVFGVVHDLLPLPTSELYNPRTVVLFPAPPPSEDQQDPTSPSNDPFDKAPSSQGRVAPAPALPLPPSSSTSHSPTTFPLSSLLRHRALLVSLLSFAASLLYPSNTNTSLPHNHNHNLNHLHQPTFPWLVARKENTLRAILDTWPAAVVASSGSKSGSTSILEPEYLRIARQVGIVEEGIWSRVLEVVKRRAKDVVEKVGTGGDEEEEMDVDGMDNGKRKKEGRKREVDGILSEIFGGMRVGEGGSKEVWAGEREREELVNGGTAAALVSLLSLAGIEDVGEDLYLVAIRTLSLLPSSLPLLSPISNLLAVNSASVAAGGRSVHPSPSKVLKRKRGSTNLDHWIDLIDAMMYRCVGDQLVDEVEEVQDGIGGKDKRSAAVRKFLSMLKRFQLDSETSPDTLSFVRNLPLALLSLVVGTQASAPLCPSIETVTRAQLQVLARGVESVPALVVIDCVRVSNRNLPSKAKIALLGAAEIGLEYVFEKETDRNFKRLRDNFTKSLGPSLSHRERNVRLAAGRLLVAFVKLEQSFNRAGMLFDRIQPLFSKLTEIFARGDLVQAKETALATLGLLGKVIDDEVLLKKIASQLVAQLGEPDPWLKAQAHCTIVSFAHHHGKTPYKLFYPFFKGISIRLVESLVSAPSMLADFVSLVNETQENFLSTTLIHTIPQLVLLQRKDILQSISKIIRKTVPVILIDSLLEILCAVLLAPDAQTDRGFTFLVGLLGGAGLDRKGRVEKVTAGGLIQTSEPVKLLYTLVVELGDTDEKIVKRALRALSKAESRSKGFDRSSSGDLGDFLKPYMLGIISNVNELLQDGRGKKSVQEKIKVIRSLGVLMKEIGVTMATFSQQILVTLQGNLNKPPLRLIVLETWNIFITTLRFKDIAPHVGPTTAAFVTSWSTFSPEERALAARTINYAIVDNGDEALGSVFDDIVSLDGIDELRTAARKLRADRKSWSALMQIKNLIRRAEDENTTISVRSLQELKTILLKPDQLALFASGNTFHPVVGELVKTLLHSAARDGDQVEELRDVSLECLGIIGALDPDRFVMSTETDKPIADETFKSLDTAQVFATRLIVELLVGAFRATNDTRYQENLAYAIQELAKFAGFTKSLLDKERTDQDKSSNPVGIRIRKRWKEIAPEKAVTIADMLDTRYKLKDSTEVVQRKVDYPIYSTSPTYREWIQRWTRDLIFKTQEGHAREIFQVFQVVIKSQDVHIARQLLPHLVLHILLSGTEQHRNEITEEIRTVLADQVDPQGDFAPDRRLLSAQTIFDLMDHLSKWIRDRRLESIKRKYDFNKASKPQSTTTKATLANLKAKSDSIAALLARVDGVIGSIDCKLTAQAALQCKAFPRSLLNFEQRILELQRDEIANAVELQQHYENLHKIYAQLDEPDGMEGISTKVLAPSLEHQIREHESTGRWTSAQSCWEVQIQEAPDDPSLHLGLLRCLRNLGHYDTLRTHIRGLISRNPEWETMLSSFQVEGAWMVGDWTAVEQILERNEAATPELAIARVLVGLKSSDEALPSALRAARLELGRPLTAVGRDSYQRFYDSVVQLHLLHELESISQSGRVEIVGMNREAVGRDEVSKLKSTLADRLGRTMPSFRVQEPILSMRRTAFSLCNNPLVDGHAEIGQAWLLSSKIARKAGHVQTAYSAVLQAGQSSTPFAFVQGAKLLASGGQALRALQELQHSLDPLLEVGLRTKVESSSSKGPSRLAKAALLKARWFRDADRFANNDVIGGFAQVIALEKEWESAYYHLGHFYDRDASERPDNLFSLQCFENTVKNYALALRCGTKYIFRTMPRMLTIWLDMGARDRMANLTKDSTPSSEGARIFKATDRNIADTIQQLPVYEWLTAFPQVVSRIGHRSALVQANLEKIIVLVLRSYPLQATWAMISVSQSKKDDRKRRCSKLLELAAIAHARSNEPSPVENLSAFFGNARQMAQLLIELAEKPSTVSSVSLDAFFPKLVGMAPSPLLLPTQEALTVALPFAFSGNHKDHNPFPHKVVTVKSFRDDIEVMSSLIRPKKITIIGSDGIAYPFLLKPQDDLRKDARLMDFNGMINKLLKNDSASRRRNLYIRTYAVVPLSEECGLCEWVSHTVPFRTIIMKYYTPKGFQIFGHGVGEDYEKFQAKGLPDSDVIAGYDKTVAKFPKVFHEWFLEMFPEPTSWLAARRAYARTYAVMCMVGFVLGLGDRHCENTLYDSNSGDTVHVDLNCLFEKGRTFDIKERVPFRLTPNQIDGFGITGVEGVYRKACEVTMRILRDNKDSLMSVLEAFVHDPLVEWENDKARIDRNQKSAKLKSHNLKNKPRVDPDAETEPTTIEALASKALAPIERKLRGVQAAYVAPGDPVPTKEISVGNQVEAVIQEATSKLNLAKMYIGWGSYI